MVRGSYVFAYSIFTKHGTVSDVRRLSLSILFNSQLFILRVFNTKLIYYFSLPQISS